VPAKIALRFAFRELFYGIAEHGPGHPAVVSSPTSPAL
jgi:hypothetical protein